MGNVEKVDRTLPLNQMIFHVRRDAELRRRWRDDFDTLAREFGLSAPEIEAVKTADVRGLNDMGVHQYYVSQILRLSFGAAGASNTHPALEAFRRAYPSTSGRATAVATVVAAMAATHAPGLTGWFDRAPEVGPEARLDGYGELRRRLEAARPDVLLMLSNDHLLNWSINNVPDYTVGIGQEHVGPADWFDEWLALPKYRIQGRPDLARAIVREGARLGLMFAYLDRLELDDGISVPLHYLTPAMQIPLVPITLNCTVPPIPSSERAYHLGEVLREIVTTRWPAEVRVAVIATGGLSHEPGGPRYLQVDEAFDRWFLDRLVEGDHRRIVRECTVERMEAAGSGGTTELIAWIAALPFTAGPAEVLGYGPTPAWRTGTGIVAWPRLA